MNKYGMITGCNDDKLKMLALQTADRPLSDYIHSWLSAHLDQMWLQLRMELQSRFAEVIDKSNALGYYAELDKKETKMFRYMLSGYSTLRKTISKERVRTPLS